MKIIPILILLIFLNSVLTADITLSLVGYINIPDDRLSYIRDKFNEYSKQNNLGIHLETLFYTNRNSSTDISNVSNYYDRIILKKKNVQYDMFLIDILYSKKYADNFEDLNPLLPDTIKELYINDINHIGKTINLVDNRLVSLPLYIDIGGLYYNDILLNKYNKSIPLTWDGLIETFNYIYEKEEPKDHLLSKYCGFPDGEAGVAATFEFIHSFRNNVEDQFPSYLSETAIEALEKMKKVKMEASDNESFALSQEEIWSNIYMNNKNYIFFRSWYEGDIYVPAKGEIGERSFKFTHLPGKQSGIYGSCIGGSNIALNKNISEERKKAAVEVLKFLFNYDFQKFLTMNVNKRSVINSIYDDADVCKTIDCSLVKNMQGVLRPNNITDYEVFSESFSRYVREYLIGNKSTTAEEVLTKIDNIERIHYVEYRSTSGIIMISLISTTIILILLSFIYICLKRRKKQFKFLPFKYWCLFLFGLTILTSSCITNIGDFGQITCTLRPVLLSLGFTITYVPFFIKLITMYPRRNIFTVFLKSNTSFIIFLFILSDIILNALWLIFDRVKVAKENIVDGASFKICKPYTNNFGLIILCTILFKNIVVIGGMGYLSIMEWNVSSYKKDVRNIGYALYSSVINIVVYLVIIFIHITSRYAHSCLRTGTAITFIISNLLVILGPKFYEISISKKKPNHLPNINSFIKKTGVFNEDFEKELKFITMEDFVDKRYQNPVLLGRGRLNRINRDFEMNTFHYYGSSSATSSSSRANLLNNYSSYNDYNYSHLSSKHSTSSLNTINHKNSKSSSSRTSSRNNY